MNEQKQIRILQMTIEDIRKDFAVSKLYVAKKLKENLEKVKRLQK